MSISPVAANLRSAAPPNEASPSASSATAQHEPDYEAVFRASTRGPDISRMQLLEPTAYGALAKLDALEAQLAGPYRVSGQQAPVHAAPTFHSNYAKSEQLQARPPLHAFAQRACGQSLQQALVNACMARPTARELVRVTQALLDAGALGDKTPVTAQDIRDLQAKFCIGIDCIGFVRTAEVALHGNAVWKGTQLHDGCTSYLDGAHGFTTRAGGLAGVAFAETGDVIHLEPSRNTENRQHNVIVRQNEIVSASDPRTHTIAARGGAALLQGGPVHLIEIVCSGGGDDTIRGVRRETWLYNESTKVWADASGTPLTAAPGLDGHERGRIYTRRGGAR